MTAVAPLTVQHTPMSAWPGPDRLGPDTASVSAAAAAAASSASAPAGAVSEPVKQASKRFLQRSASTSAGPTKSTDEQSAGLKPRKSRSHSTARSDNADQQTGQNKGAGPVEPPVLSLKPVNGTFEATSVSVPFKPHVIRIGRLQTTQRPTGPNANLYFDSKVLSRSHAEVWAEPTGQIFIKDVRSSNGTFVNSRRLSAEGIESKPVLLHERDLLELGIDIYSEDQRDIVHRKIAARVVHAGFFRAGADQDGNRMLSGSGKQRSPTPNRASGLGSSASNGQGGLYKTTFLHAPPVSVDDIGKLVTADTLRARLDAADLGRLRAQVAAAVAARTTGRAGTGRIGMPPRSRADSSPGSARSGRLSEPHPGSATGRGSFLSVSPVGGGSFSSQSSPEMDHKRLGNDAALAVRFGSATGLSELPGPADSGPPRLVEALAKTKAQLERKSQQVDVLQRLLHCQCQALARASSTVNGAELDSTVESDGRVADDGAVDTDAETETVVGCPSDVDASEREAENGARIGGVGSCSVPTASLDVLTTTTEPSENESRLQEMESRMATIVAELQRTKDLLADYQRRAEEAESRSRLLESGSDSTTDERSKPSGPAGSETGPQQVAELDRRLGAAPGLRLRNPLRRTESNVVVMAPTTAMAASGTAKPMMATPQTALFGPARMTMSTSMCAGRAPSRLEMSPSAAASWLIARAGIADGQFVTTAQIEQLESEIARMVAGDGSGQVVRRGRLGNVAALVPGMAALLDGTSDETASTLPVASLVGVVLVGVGLMTWLNGWQRR